MTTPTIESPRTYGPWTHWGPQRDILTYLNRYPYLEVQHDLSLPRGKDFRCRQVILAEGAVPDPEPVVVLDPVVNGDPTPPPPAHPKMCGEHPWLTEFANRPVPAALQEEMWELDILREDIDLEWEEYWVYFVDRIKDGDVIAAVLACRRNRVPGRWESTFNYVKNQVLAHRKKYGGDNGGS